MKVLQVIDRLNIGGAEKVMLNITQLLLDKNIDTGVLLFNPGFPLDKDIDSRAKLFGLNRTNKYSPYKLWKANNICKGFDIVHVHMRQSYAYIRLAQIIYRGKYKVLFHDHYHIETDRKVPWRLSGLFRPRYYIGVNKTLVHWAKTALGLKDADVFLLQNVVTNVRTQPFDHHDWLNVKALMVANIRQIKNIEFAIEVAQKFGCTLTIYGNKMDEQYYSRILSIINNNAAIQIIQGLTDVSAQFQQYNIAIHCSFSETGPLVLLEYLAAGIPFIAYKTGDVADTIFNELPMLFMESFVSDEWVKRISAILQDTNLPGKMRSVFNKYYSSEKYITQCLGIYQNVLC